MTTLPVSFDTFLRHAIGFDPLFNSVAQVTDNYPPHNIEKITNDHYRLTLAVAGFSKDDFDITVHDGELTIYVTRALDTSVREFLYRGIAQRNFTRRFKIGEHVEVISATCDNGLLVIDLERQVPEELKPRKIEIR